MLLSSMRSPKATDWQGRPPGAPLLKRNFPDFVKATVWRAVPDFLLQTTNDEFASSIIFVVEAISAGFFPANWGHL
jgi:hypothetical protein